jgi:uncharacterized protein (DUF1778 family)
MARQTIRDAPINLRARPAQRALIDRAAALVGKNRSDFMLEVSCREAENLLLDQCLFRLDAGAFAAFEAALAAPPSDNPALRAVMAAKAPWEA